MSFGAGIASQMQCGHAAYQWLRDQCGTREFDPNPDPVNKPLMGIPLWINERVEHGYVEVLNVEGVVIHRYKVV